jgi:hypothetical protein
VLIAWFDSDDILRRFAVMWVLTCKWYRTSCVGFYVCTHTMAGLLGFTTNIAAFWDHTYTPLIGFYLAARLFVACAYLWHGYVIPMVRAAMVGIDEKALKSPRSDMISR